MNLSYVARIVAIGALVGLLVMIGLQQSSTVGPQAPATMTASGQQVEAPDFTLNTVSGEPFTLSSLEGQSPVIVNFFATT